MKRIVACALVAISWSVTARSAAAQDDASHFYFTGGFGGGRFTPQCDTGCFGDAMNSNSVMLVAGWHITPRVRGEFALDYQPATGVRSHAGSLSAGVAVYLVGNLYIRGGVSRLDLSVEDSVGVTEGKGGPGFMAGAGYDLFISDKFAISAYANYFAGSIKQLAYDAGAGIVSTAGSVTAFNAGISFTYRAWRHQ